MKKLDDLDWDKLRKMDIKFLDPISPEMAEAMGYDPDTSNSDKIERDIEVLNILEELKELDEHPHR